MNLKKSRSQKVKLNKFNSVTHNILNGAFFIIGVCLASAGVLIARSKFNFGIQWLDTLANFLGEYVWSSSNVFMGVSIALMGAVLAGLSARSVLPDYLRGRKLEVPKPERDFLALAAFFLAALLYVLLCWHLLTEQYTHWDILLFFGSLALIGFGIHRWDRRKSSTICFKWLDLAIVLCLVFLTIGVNLFGLTSWKFAGVGDEGAFFAVAKRIPNGELWSFFDFGVVYGEHPMLDTIYAGLLMNFFGSNIFTWRMSEVLLSAASAAMIYLLACLMFGRFPAISAGIVLGCSQYLMTFNRVAKNNSHVIFYTVLVLLMLVLAWRTRKSIFVFLTGVAMGFCLYTILHAVITWLIVAVILLIIFFRRPSWSQVIAGAIMLFGFALVVTPALINTPISKIVGVASDSASAELMSDATYWSKASVRIVQSSLVFWIGGYHSGYHYIWSSLLDPITGILLMVGLGIAIFRINKRAEGIALLLLALGIIIPAGLTLHYWRLPLTRLLYALPGVALLACLAVSKMDFVMRKNFRINLYFARTAIFVFILLIPVLNVQQVMAENKYDRTPHGFSRWLRVLQQHPEAIITEIGIAAEPDSRIMGMLKLYPWLASRYQYISMGELETFHSDKLKDSLPIYFVVYENRGILPEIEENLSNNYKMVKDYDKGEFQSWLFILK